MGAPRSKRRLRDGRQEQRLLSPVIVLRKYNQYSFLALPLTTNAKPNKWRVSIGLVAGRDAFAVLSQLRNVDSRRLIEKKGHVPLEMLAILKKAASRMNFG